jgi:hypothetical protein
MDVKDVVPLEQREQLVEMGYTTKAKIITFSSVFRWFRKKHMLVHEINSYVEKWGIVYDYEVFSLVLPKDAPLGEEGEEYDEEDLQMWETLVEKDLLHTESISYEAAELECLKWLIKYVKEREA